jgi:hypothetical protein
MTDPAHLDGLIDLLVEALVREIESTTNENARGADQAKPQAFGDSTCNSLHDSAGATAPAASATKPSTASEALTSTAPALTSR